MPIWCTGKIQFGDAEPGHRVGDAVAAEHRDLPLGEATGGSRDARPAMPWLGLSAPPRPRRGVAAGRDAEDVAGADLDTERLLGRLELGAVMTAASASGSPPFARHQVEEHPAPDDAVGERHDRVAARAVAAHVGRGPAVVHLAAHEHVAQRVDVRDAEPVHLRADVVAARLVARDAVFVAAVARGEHVVVRGERALGRGVDAEVVRQADRHAVDHERGGASAVLGGEVVERAELVVGAPPTPVGDRSTRPRARRARPRSAARTPPACSRPGPLRARGRCG